MTDEPKDKQDLDWENRVLCSDESCIGVIGPDGRCKECGRPYEGRLPDGFNANPLGMPTVDEQQEQAADSVAEAREDLHEPEGELDADDEWSRRKLCRDESCIGVIGPDGRCKECGLPYED